ARVPSSREYSRPASPGEEARKFDAGTIGTFSGCPGSWTPRPECGQPRLHVQPLGLGGVGICYAVPLPPWCTMLHYRVQLEAHSTGTRELLLVLDGEVELRVGDRTERLGVGDSVTFAGDLPHGYATPAGAATPARFALTVFQPHVGGGRK